MTTWNVPRASAGLDGDCFEDFYSGQGTQMLTFTVTRPLTATFVRSGRAYGVEVNSADIAVRGRLERHGSIVADVVSLRPECGDTVPQPFGDGSPNGDCGVIVEPWFLSMGLNRGDLTFGAYPKYAIAPNNGRSNGGFGFAECPLFAPLPETTKEGTLIDYAVNLIPPVKAGVDLAAIFDCKRKSIPVAADYSVQGSGFYPADTDPTDPAQARYHARTETTISIGLQRLGCGVG